MVVCKWKQVETTATKYKHSLLYLLSRNRFISLWSNDRKQLSKATVHPSTLHAVACMVGPSWEMGFILAWPRSPGRIELCLCSFSYAKWLIIPCSQRLRACLLAELLWAWYIYIVIGIYLNLYNYLFWIERSIRFWCPQQIPPHSTYHAVDEPLRSPPSYVIVECTDSVNQLVKTLWRVLRILTHVKRNLAQRALLPYLKIELSGKQK